MSRRPPETDLCLSAHPTSANAARAILRFFRQAGLKAIGDENDALEGASRLWAIHHGVDAAQGHVVLLAEDTPAAWAEAELVWALKRRALHPDLWVLPLVREGFQPGVSAPWVDALGAWRLPEDKTEANNRLRELVLALREGIRPTPLPLAMNAGPPAKPHPGLRPYGQLHAPYFFGREAEVLEMGQRLGHVHAGHRRWLHVSGPSGVGKTSLLRAGLVPAVRRGVVARGPTDWSVAVLRPGRRPVLRLADALARCTPGAPPAHEVLETLQLDHGLADFIREEVFADQGALLVMDHLEDLLVCDASELDRLDRLLASAIGDFDERLYLVTSARDDLGPRALERLPRTAELARTRAAWMEVGGPTREGLWEAIRGPVALAGGHFADGLAERILDDVERTSDALPRLGHLLQMLWERSWEGELTHATYEALGGVSGALARSAETLVDGLAPDELRRAHALTVSLVSVGHGRGDSLRVLGRTEALAAAGGGPKADAVLQTLQSAERGGLLVSAWDEVDDEASPPSGAEARPTVRWVHEALLRDWPRLRVWIEEGRDALDRREACEARARAWMAANKSPEALPPETWLPWLEGQDLTPELHELHKQLMSTEARRFLEAAHTEGQRRAAEVSANAAAAERAVTAHRAAERAALDEKIRRLRLTVGALVAGLVVATGLTLMAYFERNDLAEQRDTVETARRRMQQERAELETQKLEAEKQRLDLEARYRDAERSSQVAGRQSARAGQTADDLVRIALEIGLAADDAMARIPGDVSKYSRRVVAQAVSRKIQDALDAAPDNEILQFAAARQHELQATLWVEQKQLRQAAQSYEAAQSQYEAIIAKATPTPRHFIGLVTVRTALGDLYRREPFKEVERAVVAWRAAIEALRKLETLEPDVAEHRAGQLRLLRRAGRALAEAQLIDAALKTFDEATTYGEALAKGLAPAAEVRLAWIEAYVERAEAAMLANRRDSAKVDLARALELLEGADGEEAGKLVRRAKVRLKALGG